MEICIKEITGRDGLSESIPVVRNAFATVAEAFGLNRENCPTNAAFIEMSRLDELQAKGALLFGLYKDGSQIGFIVLEKGDARTYYIEKLAVVPEERHQGYGKTLMDFACLHVASLGAGKVSIGIINENSVLKQWYQQLGFQETEIRAFEHMPFTVCFMEKIL